MNTLMNSHNGRAEEAATLADTIGRQKHGCSPTRRPSRSESYKWEQKREKKREREKLCERGCQGEKSETG